MYSYIISYSLIGNYDLFLIDMDIYANYLMPIYFGHIFFSIASNSKSCPMILVINDTRVLSSKINSGKCCAALHNINGVQ